MLTDAEFAIVAREVKTRSGAVLTKDLAGACEVRLAPLSRREGFGSVAELLSAARIRPDGALYAAIADALAQSETRFFRDKANFARLRNELLPKAIQRRGHERVRIWSAACATGQEAYSVAMTIEELRNQGQAVAAEIVATDMSERLITKARSGLYTQFEVQRGLPIRTLIAYFEKTGDLWRIADRLRATVRYEQHNLLKHPGALGQFDIIFCCHVLNSFDEPTRAATFQRLADALAPEGVIVLGAGETAPEGVEGLVVENGVVRKGAARKAA
ncbi:CheR family methyltransferase [Terricaulis sp.]|uniref:CheR family methyltransferase n=1 Tax=Terricaulis sp. TaxID=2768686 RepID=UPI003782EE1C